MTISLSAHALDPLSRQSRLVVIAGAEADLGRVVVWSGGELRIGTAADCDLALADPTVSRHHCVVTLGPQGPAIHDLGSTNGTGVGGYRVESAYLRPGAVISVGHTRLRFEADAVATGLDDTHRFGLLLGRSLPMRRMFDDLRRVAESNATVMIQGETGTGKELIAETLHAASARARGPFVVFDCARVTPTLMEAELFGHVRGAFTGADDARVGVMESAHGGTVFLDEIGELPLELQPKLLRVLESQVVCPVGSDRPRRIDVRIVAASNRDLRDEVDRGAFRADLFYRLDVFTLRVPALRERIEDLPLLARHFYRQFVGDSRAEVPDDLLIDIAGHAWPGNVRELRSAVERWVLLGASLESRLETVPLTEPEVDDCSFRDAKARIVSQWEADYLRRLLRRHRGNVSSAARAVKMSRNHLTDLLKKYGVDA